MKLLRKHFFAYGLGDLGANLLFQPAAVFLLAYYTDVRGLPAASVGLLFLVVRLWDGISDPLMGWLAERTQSRLGRFRPWIGWGAVPAGISVALLFWNPGQSGSLAAAWLTYLFFITAFTVVNVPFGAMTAALTQDHHERSRLTAYRLFFGIAGAVGVGLAFPVLVAAFGGGESGYSLTGWLTGALAALALGLSFWGLPADKGPAFAPSAGGDFFSRLKNTPFWRVTLAFFFGFSALSLLLALLPYYFNHVLGQPQNLGWGILAFQGMTGITLPLWLRVTQHLGKRNTLWAGLACYLTGFLGLALWGQWPLVWLALIGAGNGSAALTSWSMLADTVDYGEMKTGIRSEGALFGVFGFFFKAGLGVGGAMASWGLAWAGYMAHSPLDAETLRRITAVCLGGPPLLTLAMGLCLVGYPLTAAYHRQVLDTLAAKAVQ